MDTIAVLIPCYNEAKTIEKVVADFASQLPQATIYVYDNNSTDKTAQLAQAAGAVVRQVTQQGKGNVIRAMFRDIEAQCYLMIDGDDTYPADHANEMVAPVLTGRADMVIGDRLASTYFTENKRPFHNSGNRIVRALINHTFNSHIGDIMTGYRAFSYAFVKTFAIQSQGFEIETEMTIHALDKQLAIETVVVNYRDRPQGSVSKLNTFRDGFRVLSTIGKLYKNYRPMECFSLLSALITCLGLFFLIPVWGEYRLTGLVDRFPTLIGAGFMLLTAILIFVVGLLLDVQAYHYRQAFELSFMDKKSYLDHHLKASQGQGRGQ